MCVSADRLQSPSAIDSCRSFLADDSGAAFLEYTVLLGIILVVAIVTLSKVGNFANATWTSLCSTLGSDCS